MIFVHKCVCCQPCWVGERLLICKIAGPGFSLHIARWWDWDCSERRETVVIEMGVGSEVPRVAVRGTVASGEGSSLPNGFGVPLPSAHPNPH